MRRPHSVSLRRNSSGKWPRHKALGISPKVVLIGPLTYLYLGKETTPGFNRLDLLPHLLPVYRDILAQLAASGVEWVQIDEPLLALDLDDDWLRGLDQAYPHCRERKTARGSYPSYCWRLILKPWTIMLRA